MKHWIWAAAACGLLSLAVPTGQAAEGKIGFVNLAKVFDNYERTKSSDAVLEQKGKQKEAELETKMNDLKKMREGLELLSEEMRESKSRQLEQKSDEVQLFRKNTAQDLRRERDRIAKDILEEIQKGIEEYAKANGYALIIDERSLLYGAPTIDLTDELLAALNKKPGKLPAAAAPMPKAQQ